MLFAKQDNLLLTQSADMDRKKTEKRGYVNISAQHISGFSQEEKASRKVRLKSLLMKLKDQKHFSLNSCYTESCTMSRNTSAIKINFSTGLFWNEPFKTTYLYP